MDRPATCGQGLAAHAPLQAALSELAAATADVLEAHLPMIDRADPASEREYGAYVRFIEAHRRVARELHALAAEMEGCRSLPMGRHRDDPGANAAMAGAFTRFVAREEALARLLGDRLRGDREMLAAMPAQA